jgi:hypothetical protein
MVRGVGLCLLRGGAAVRIKRPDACGIALPGFGSADIFNAVALPQAIGGAEGGQSAFCADASSGEYEHSVSGVYRNGFHETYCTAG